MTSCGSGSHPLIPDKSEKVADRNRDREESVVPMSFHSDQEEKKAESDLTKSLVWGEIR